MLIFPAPRRLEFNAGADGPTKESPLHHRRVDKGLNPEGFRLKIQPTGVTLEYLDDAGKFYGSKCWQQILNQCMGAVLPCLELEDWPDLRVRGFMLDISRCKVPTLNTLKRLVRLLSLVRYNQLQLYTEHTFAYKGHSLVWGGASPLTDEDIRELDRYCLQHHIELVPNQNSFGHFERWLRYPEYQHLAECPKGFDHPVIGKMTTGTTLHPDQQSLDFIASLYDDLLPHFSSGQINAGCDEPWELGMGRSQNRVEKLGRQAVYQDFVHQLCNLAASRGKKMQFWAQIARDAPEKLEEVPDNGLPIIWGYEDDHPYEEECSRIREIGSHSYLVAPGTSSWNSLTGRWNIAEKNLSRATAAAVDYGAMGMINCCWGDRGHPYEWPYMLPPLLAGGALSWNTKTFNTEDLRSAMDRFVFQDDTGNLAAAVLDLGNLEAHLGPKIVNRSYLFFAFSRPDAEVKKLFSSPNLKIIQEWEAYVQDRRVQAQSSEPEADDGLWLRDEVLSGIDLSLFALQRVQYLYFNHGSLDRAWLRVLIGNFERNWLRRNRYGGLMESSQRLRLPYFPEDKIEYYV